MCALHCAQLLHTILHRTDLIVFLLTVQIIIIALMISIQGKGEAAWVIYIIQVLREFIIFVQPEKFPRSEQIEFLT